MVHYLKNDPGPQQVSKFESEDNHNSTHFNVSATNNYTQTSTQLNEEKNDLALGYTFVDVKDEENEGTFFIYIYTHNMNLLQKY